MNIITILLRMIRKEKGLSITGLWTWVGKRLLPFTTKNIHLMTVI